MLQWHDKAVEPPGDARSDLWFIYHLGQRIREKLRRLRPTSATGRCWTCTWDYPTEGADDEPTPRRCCARSTAADADGQALSAYTELKDDGSTACGCWIYCGVYADGVNQAARRKPALRAELGRARVGLGVAGQPAHPLQPRVGRPDGKPWSERKKLRLVGRRAGQVDRARRARLRAPTSRRTTSRRRARTGPDAHRRRRPVHHAGRRQGLAVRARPGWSTGRCPTHYEPHGVAGRATRSTASSATRRARSRGASNPYNPLTAGAPATCFPYVAHHLPAHRAPHRRRDEPHAALPGRAAAGDVLRGLARARRASAAWSTAAGRRSSPRATAIEARVLVTERMRPLRVGGRVVHQVGLPYHWGGNGLVHRRLGQRPAHRRRSTRTCTSRRSRRAPATSGRAAGRAGAGADRRCVEDYRRRAGARTRPATGAGRRR